MSVLYVNLKILTMPEKVGTSRFIMKKILFWQKKNLDCNVICVSLLGGKEGNIHILLENCIKLFKVSPNKSLKDVIELLLQDLRDSTLKARMWCYSFEIEMKVWYVTNNHYSNWSQKCWSGHFDPNFWMRNEQGYIFSI